VIRIDHEARAEATSKPEEVSPRPSSWLVRHSLVALSLGSVVVVIGAWQLASTYLISPFFLPSPSSIVQAFQHLLANGQLEQDTGISLFRILSGWLLGSLVGAPVGFLLGTSRVAKAVLDPFVHFLRFIPALALVSLFMVWFGVGEESKILLIMYAVAFLVTVTTATGVAAISDDKVAAAKCLGSSGLALFWRVRVPAAMPHVYTAMRLGMANAFLVIIAVEIIAANSGLGYLIWTARLYFQISWMFVGVVTLGILGVVTDRLWRLLGRTLLRRYVGASARY
jgi:NitT/TauT family transport system permease protein